MSRHRSAWVLLFAASAISVAGGPGRARAQAPAPGLAPAERPSASAGLAIFEENCIRCHGVYGRGDGEIVDELPAPPRDLSAPATVRSMSPAEAYEIVTDGRLESLMPPWRNALSDSERWDVVYGAWSFYFTPSRLVRAADAWQRECAECHGAAGVGGPGDAGTALARLLAPERLAAHSGIELMALVEAAAEHADLLARTDRETRWLAVDHLRALGFRPTEHEGLTIGGRLEGRVVNGSAEADPEWSSAGEITVRAAPLGMVVPGEIVSATVGTAREFALDVVRGPGIEHQVSAVYRGIEYVYDPGSAAAVDGSGEPLELRVFEIGADVDVRVTALHAVLAPVPQRGLVEVVERWSVEADGDRTRVSSGADDPTAVFGLLSGARNLRVHGGAPVGAMRLEGETMLDLRPVPPGGRDVVLIYDLPYESETLELRRALPRALEAQTMTVSDPNAVAEAEWAVRRERVELLGQDVEQLLGGPFSEGEVIAVRLDGLTAPAADAVAGGLGQATAVPAVRIVSQRSIARAGLIGVGLAIAVALVYPLIEGGAVRIRPRRPGPARSGRIARTERRREQVLEELLNLERQSAAGEIAPNAYARRRAELIGTGIALEEALEALRDRAGHGEVATTDEDGRSYEDGRS